MNENKTYDVRTQSTAKDVALCAIALLFAGILLPSSALATGKSTAMYQAEVGKITIEVDPRVELISIVCRLASYPEYNDGILRPYVKAIEKQFGDFDNHPVIKMAAELRQTRLMSADGPMSLAVHIDGNYRLRETTVPWPATLDSRWKKQETDEFLRKLRQFAAETKFDEFFQAQAPFYEQGIRLCASIAEQKELVIGQPSVVIDRFLAADLGEWLEDFFGVENTGDLKLVLGFANGYSNYGPRFENDHTSEKFAIVGMRPFDAANNVIFLPQQMATAVHEFCHSFCNPVVDKYMDQLQPAGEKLFAAQGPTMRSRGYQNWRSVMYETAVRACVARFIGSSVADQEFMSHYVKREVGHGFIWTEHMANVLEKYEGNRDKYPTFEAFFPEFVASLNEYSQDL